MSLYTHFANKEELLDLMYVEVARRLYPDSGQPDWQAELLTLGHHMRRTLLAHPRWTPLLSRHTQPMVVEVRERVLKEMVAGGVAHPRALEALATVFLVILGLCLVELGYREPDGSSGLERRYQRVKTAFQEGADNGAEPTSQEAFAKMRQLNLEGAFDLALRTLIDGLPRRLAEST